MCNLSEVVLEKGIKQGIEKGIEQGIEQGIEKGIEQKLTELVSKKIEKGYKPEQIAEMLEEDVAVIEPIYAAVMKQRAN